MTSARRATCSRTSISRSTSSAGSTTSATTRPRACRRGPAPTARPCSTSSTSWPPRSSARRPIRPATTSTRYSRTSTCTTSHTAPAAEPASCRPVWGQEFAPLAVDSRGGRWLPGDWVPAAQVLDGLAVLPLDGVFEQVGQVPAGGDAGDVGDGAAGPDGDDEPLVVEGERLQRPGIQLRVQVAGDLDAAVVAGRQPRIGHKLGCFHPARPDEHAALNQLAVGEPEALLGG